jgi:hypothetical protein
MAAISCSMFQPRKAGSSQMSFQPQKAESASVVAAEALLQVRPQVGFARLLDAGDGDVLHEDVRGQHDRPAQGFGERGRVEQGDGAAVAVAEEPGRVARGVEPQRAQQRGEHLVRLPVHEARRPALVRAARRGTAVARAGVHQPARAGGLAQACREVAPHRDGTQALVQEHEHGRPGRGAADPLVFDAHGAAGPGDLGEGGVCGGAGHGQAI